jgi:glutathione-regulated potassium-efflux system protein KefB
VLTLLAVMAIATSLSRWLGLGSVLALLFAGVALGPSGFQIVPDVERLRSFAELGVVLLMFAIGLEMEPQRLWAMRRLVFGLGVLQVVGTALLLGALLFFRYGGVETSVLGGLGLALSSTAIGLQLLTERGEIDTRHGRASVAILLLQDLAIVPLLAILPLLGPGEASGGASLAHRVARVAIVLAALFGLGRWVLPRALRYQHRFGEARDFAVVIFLAIVGAAVGAEWAGLSMALGAFVIGMMLSQSEFEERIDGIVRPLKQAMLDLFFIAVGMSIDLNLLAQRGLQMALTVITLVALKALALYTLARWFQLGHAGAFRMAALLSQAGEFGFVLFGAAVTEGVISTYLFNIAVLVIALSMAATPLLLKGADALAEEEGLGA